MAATGIQYSVEELAKELGATFCGNKDHLITAVASLETATSNDVSFFHNEKYRQALQRTSAGLVIAAAVDPESAVCNWLIHENPSLAFQKAIELFCNKLDVTPYQGIHPSAIVDPSAKLSEGVTLSPGCVIGPRCVIGANSYIGPGTILGSDVSIGEKCLIHAKVVIRESCLVGHRVIIQPGAVIGSCGFGYNTQQGQHIKLEQLGNVVIEDDVEIGANTTIDRARFKQTKIGRGSKIDNLVMIAHGVEVGEDNLIVAQVGIAGSSKTGRWVVLGGQVGVAGHLEIGKGTQVAAQSGVSKNLISGVYGGTPAQPMRQWHESIAHLQSIARIKKKIQLLEERLELLQNKLDSDT